MIALMFIIGMILLVGIVGYCIVYMIDKIQSDRYYKRQHNREVRRALRQINKSRNSVVLTGTTTEHWVNMCKEIEKED